MLKIPKITGINIAGSKLATFMLHTFNMLRPSAIITKLPTAVIEFITLSLNNPDKKEAPSKTQGRVHSMELLYARQSFCRHGFMNGVLRRFAGTRNGFIKSCR